MPKQTPCVWNGKCGKHLRDRLPMPSSPGCLQKIPVPAGIVWFLPAIRREDDRTPRKAVCRGLVYVNYRPDSGLSLEPMDLPEICNELARRRLFLSDVDEVKALEELGKLRLRWNVENKNHHPRDATLLEDKCRCRTGNTSANLAILRGVVLTLWKKTRPNTPATAYIAKNQKNLDALIALTNKNQRLKKLK